MSEALYQNGAAPLADIVAAFAAVEGVTTDRFSREQLHNLADLITTARHDRHGQRGLTRETVVIADRDGTELATIVEFTSTSTEEGEK